LGTGGARQVPFGLSPRRSRQINPYALVLTGTCSFRSDRVREKRTFAAPHSVRKLFFTVGTQGASMKRTVLKAVTSAAAILILAAGCSQSPTAPTPGDVNNGVYADAWG
jgi:hypothetical protein